MTTFQEILDLLADELANIANITATPRYFVSEELGDVDDTPRYYVEPGGLEIERRNVGAPRQIFHVRATSVEYVESSGYNETIVERVAQWETVAYKLVQSPRLDYNAFVRKVTTFNDAPATYSTDATNMGVTLLNAGVDVEIVVD